MNLLARANNNENLTPLERAAIRFGELLLAAALAAGIPAVVTGLQGGQVNWQAVATAVVIAVLMTALKLVTASGDPPLPAQPASPAPKPPAAGA